MREYYFGGREHAAIKHYFLRKYLEVLAFKTLQAQRGPDRYFAYIDGFTGPWGARDDESYSDTSFGVALEVLKRVKARLENVYINCVFCETRRRAFQKLQRHVAENADDINVKCVYGRFEDNITDITDFVGRRGFLFAFIDPKGWRVDARAITPLLEERWSEVLFNFMAEFIGRFPDYDKVREAYAALLGDVDWRVRFDSTPADLSNEDRVLLLFRSVLKERWRFSHVLELPIRKPNRDRIFYKLVYGTRSSHGVLAFREAQAKAEKEGYAVVAEAESGKQMALFSPDEQAEHIVTAVGVSSPKHVAQLTDAISQKLKCVGQASFLDLAADVLEAIPAREKDVKITLQAMKSDGVITFSNFDGANSLRRNSIITWCGCH